MGDIDVERVKMNQELRSSNFYSRDPILQVAVQDPLASTEKGVNQARDFVYGHAQNTTNVNMRPIKQTESSLLKLTDIANQTRNILSSKEAQHATTPVASRLVQNVKNLFNITHNPTSA